MRILTLAGTLALLLTSTTPARAQHAAIDREVERLAPQITDIRHQIHEHPELGNRETETAALVADHLRALGFDDVRTEVAHTGVVAVLRGGKPGPVVAVRADMDALPVTEDTDLSFRSTVRSTYLGQEVGVMHACGHDVHTAVQLGVASILKSLQDDLPGTVVFLFQPAEEGPPPDEEGGASLMLQEGAFAEPRPEARPATMSPIWTISSQPIAPISTAAVRSPDSILACSRSSAAMKSKAARAASSSSRAWIRLAPMAMT